MNEKDCEMKVLNVTKVIDGFAWSGGPGCEDKIWNFRTYEPKFADYGSATKAYPARLSVSMPPPTKKVWQWRFRSKTNPQWKISKRLMDYADAFELFIGHEFEPHAGPFEVAE